MAIKNYERVWHNGKLIAWEEATVHVAAHVISYASCLFEGIRCYDTPQGPAIFRLKEHTDRLVNSCKIYRMDLTYTREQLAQAMVELVRVNNVRHCYIRPVVFRGYGEVGVNPLKNPIEIYLLAWEWGKYLGDEALRQGVDVCISSWQRIAPNTLPAMAKAAANYMNAQLIKMEALTNGYVEGISLDAAGHVSDLGDRVRIGEREVRVCEALKNQEVVFRHAAHVEDLEVIVDGKRLALGFLSRHRGKAAGIGSGFPESPQHPLAQRLPIAAFVGNSAYSECQRFLQRIGGVVKQSGNRFQSVRCGFDITTRWGELNILKAPFSTFGCGALIYQHGGMTKRCP